MRTFIHGLTRGVSLFSLSRRGLLTAAGSMAALLLAGCSASTKNVPCPHVAIVPDLQAVAKFKAGAGRADSDLAYGARLLDAAVSCSQANKGKAVDVTTKLGVQATRTDTTTRAGQVAYFVAVVNRTNAIVAKRDFVVDLKFSGDQGRVEVTEEHHELIPLPKGLSGADYGIVFGFQLSPEELKYNRAHLKPPGSG